MRLRSPGAIRLSGDHSEDRAASDRPVLGIHVETVNVAIHELEDRQHIAIRGFGKARRIYHLCSNVFGHKQRAGIEEVISSPSRTPRLASLTFYLF